MASAISFVASYKRVGTVAPRTLAFLAHTNRARIHGARVLLSCTGGSQTPVPVIDITPLLNEVSGTSEDWLRVGNELRAACTEVGFFHLAGHGVDETLMSNALSNAVTFFEQDQSKKDKIWIGNSRYGNFIAFFV